MSAWGQTMLFHTKTTHYATGHVWKIESAGKCGFILRRDLHFSSIPKMVEIHSMH